MIHIFLDTDIILDVITGRLPYSEEASSLFTLIEEGHIRSSVSSLSFSNIYYVLRKYATHQRVVSRLKELSELLDIVDVDESIIKRALQSEFKDFEDAIQYFVALSDPNIKVIVTRNIKDYKVAELSVMTPETFLKTYNHIST
jgi:predicted nucleic acid-binding protein